MDSLAHGTSYEFGTRVLTDWLRYLILGATTDRCTLDDPQLTQLRNAAISASADPVEFLNNLPQLRGLLEYPAFLEEFRRAFADS